MRFNEIDDAVVAMWKQAATIADLRCSEFAFQDSGEQLIALSTLVMAHISGDDRSILHPDRALLSYAVKGMLAHLLEIEKTEPRGEYESN